MEEQSAHAEHEPFVPRLSLYHFWFGVAASRLGNQDESQAHLYEAVLLAQALGAQQLEAQAYLQLARSALVSCRFGLALSSAQNALLLCGAAPRKHSEVWARWASGMSQLGLGQLAESRLALTHAGDLASALADPRLHAFALAGGGFVEVCCGNAEQALDLFGRARAELTEPAELAFVNGLLGFARVRAGDARGGAELLATSLDSLASMGLELCTALMRALFAEATFEAADATSAEREARVARAECEKLACAFGVAWAERVLARVEFARGAATVGMAWLEGARQAFAEMGASFEAACSEGELQRLAGAARG